jgi:DNA helicase-2/ATP-dependent DNA helicase PcrA
MSEQHPAFPEELARLDYTLKYVHKSLETTDRDLKQSDQLVTRLNRQVTSDNSQGYIDLMVNTVIRDGLVLKLRNLHTACQKPYFARIDFAEVEKEGVEKLYIGKMCLIREEDQQLVIIDWRAPVANLYYEGRLGETSYVCPDGEIRGELSLKRQFSIEGGVLQQLFDIDITTNDEFLQSYLGANADNRLKDIVSTIQAEQNRIIRAELDTPLIVQGVAGSGKTTIALHRIAYLIYNYNQAFQPENFMIIAPNRLFLNYISEVLPELGVERVKQTTFEDFAAEVIGEKYKLRDANEKLVEFVDHNTNRETRLKNEMQQKASAFKSSLDFKAILDRYIAIVEKNLLPEQDLKLEQWNFFTQREIDELYFRDYQDWPAYRRLDQLKKHFTKRVKERKDAFCAKLQEDCNLKVDQIKLAMPESDIRREFILQTIDRKNERVRKLEEYARTCVKSYFSALSPKSVLQYYKSFISEPIYFETLAENRVSGELMQLIREQTMANLRAGYLETEDLAPVLYLKGRLYGLAEKIKVKHIVIDEAQDFSIFQFYTMKQIIKDSTFTIFGDLAQGIHSYRAITDWETLREHVFLGKAGYLTLEQSYRTTIEIMEAANRVLKKLGNARPAAAKTMVRHGASVTVISKSNLQEITTTIGERIGELTASGFKSIAVIGKTTAECQEIYELLKKRIPALSIVTGKETEYKAGIVVVPVYLAKGLEFDAVFIANGSQENYQENDLDIKLLYVAMTRPLHYLDIYYYGELSPLLRDLISVPGDERIQ